MTETDDHAAVVGPLLEGAFALTVSGLSARR
jgi:hypothetical protein